MAESSVLMRIAPELRRLEALEHARMPLTQYDVPAVAEELALGRHSLERLADAVESMAAVEAERLHRLGD